MVVRGRSLNFIYSEDGLWHRFVLERLEAAACQLATRKGWARAEAPQVEPSDKKGMECEH